MPGIAVNRFVDLEEGMAAMLKCGVCLDVLDNAVDTECGHSFCESCITSAIETNNRLVCPECRHESTIATNDDNEWVMKTSLRINGIISKLKISCDLADKGCEEVIEFGLLAAHLKICPFNVCDNCGLTLAVKQENESLKTENQALTDKCRQLSDKCHELKVELKELKREVDPYGRRTRRTIAAIVWPIPYEPQRCQYPDCWSNGVYVHFDRYDDHCKRAQLRDGTVGHTWREGGWLEPVIPEYKYSKQRVFRKRVFYFNN